MQHNHHNSAELHHDGMRRRGPSCCEDLECSRRRRNIANWMNLMNNTRSPALFQTPRLSWPPCVCSAEAPRGMGGLGRRAKGSPLTQDTGAGSSGTSGWVWSRGVALFTVMAAAGCIHTVRRHPR
ncbi:hypothetical protein E2C01_089876 [Portunus trituberculatus]|uniref:Uncharacterized protein n=1 Tax=Portunus trituberculatus TaxID=210409 RepID=A0A5B7JJF5_PORTR|nr:hypothetical protein [Portunus trituberculatus]